MKAKFFFLLVLLLGFGVMTFAQSASDAPATKTDATSKTMTTATKAGTTQQTVTTKDCKFVDANHDGLCDTCGKKDCHEPSKAATSGSNCDPACTSKCPSKSSSCCSSKGGKKNE